MKLVTKDNPILKTVCHPIDFNDTPFDLIEFSQNLVKFMYDHNGIGLSANQIGVPYRIFAMRGQPENFVFINPRVVDVSEDTMLLEEACLSYPGLIVKIKRPKHVRVRFNTPNGDTRTEKFTGISARCVLHEMDHLDGKVFYRAASDFYRLQALNNLKKFERRMKRAKNENNRRTD